MRYKFIFLALFSILSVIFSTASPRSVPASPGSGAGHSGTGPADGDHTCPDLSAPADSSATVTELEEAVVTSFGISRERKSLGYAVTSLDASRLNTKGSGSLQAALQGRVSGLDIRPSSGAPGASAQMWIRGARSFTGNNRPLMVIDGMPIESAPDFSTGNSTRGADLADRAIDINPQEIENVTVLKGQAAAALYGIRASNGVIVITTRRGAKEAGRPSVTFSTDISAETASRRFHRQETYAQGNSINAFDPNSANTWGPKIQDLPNDPKYGGNLQGHPGQYYNPKLEQAGLDPWVTPAIHDNIGAFLRTGITENTRLSISQRTRLTTYSIGIGNTWQKGIVPSTGMNRWTMRGNFSVRLSDEWETGMNANYSSVKITSAPGANNAIMNSVNTAPAEFDLKGVPPHVPNDPSVQVSYRPTVYDNPYWWTDNNEYSQHTNRGFGNVWLDYSPSLLNRGILSFKVSEKAGIDFYTTDNATVLRIGSAAARKGSINNYGVSRNVFNNLLTLCFGVRPGDFDIDLLLGNEINQDNARYWDYVGTGFNFYGFPVMGNATSFSNDEYKIKERTVGFFGSLSAGWRGMLYVGATLRDDYVSMMPRGHRSLLYPSFSVTWIFSELLRGALPWLSLGKLRGSYAQVGQAAHYITDYYAIPTYGGGMFTSTPIAYPVDGISSYVPYAQIYDPGLKPQNTRNLETGIDLAILDNRIRASYTLSLQDVKDQIFSVPQAGSTGYVYMLTNAGHMRIWSNEIDLDFHILRHRDYDLSLNVNLTTVRNRVVSLAPGVESIMLGGFSSPQIRAEEGKRYPIVYGTSFKRDTAGNLLLRDGLPQSSGESVDLGECSPDLLAGFGLNARWKSLSLSATLSWQDGGKMYHGSNMVLNASGVTKASLPYHEGTMVAAGTDEATGLPNLVEVSRQKYYQAYYSISESAVYDMSFVKLRDLTLSWELPKAGPFRFTLSAFVRNLLVWTRLPDFDPESSQGNGNMGGYFERFSIPATTAYGGGLKVEF